MKPIGKSRNQLHAFLGSCFFTLWILFFFALLQNITFETNDDNAMARMIYGAGTNYYDTHLVYINVLAGKVMKLFLLLFPTIPWYTVLQCALILLSFFVIIFLFISRFGFKSSLLPIFLLVFFFVPEFLLKLQFSKTAGIASIAGVLILFDGVKPDAVGKIWKHILGSILIFAGSLYRFNGFAMVLPPMLGVGLWMLWKPLSQKNWKQLLQICLPFIIIFGLCFLFRQYNTKIYQQDPVWAAYKEFNSLRAQLLDYGFPDYQSNIALYDSLGISEADLSMFKSWDIADPDVFNVEAMRQLIAAKAPPEFSWHACLENIKAFFTGSFYSIAMLIAFCLAIATPKPKRFLLLVFAILSVVAIQVYLYSSGRYGLNRLNAPLALVLFVVPVIYCWGDVSFSNNFVPITLSAVLLVTPFYNFQQKQPPTEPVPLYELMNSDSDSMYLRTLSVSTPLIPSPYEVCPVGYQDNYAALGGWTVYSRPFIEKMAAFNISNPFRDMVDNPSVFFIAKSGLNSRLAYIRRHYAPDAQAYLVKVTEDGYPIYRIATTPHPVVDLSQAVLANGNEAAHYGYALSTEEKVHTFHGHFYVDGANSFSSNIYFSLTSPEGIETTYYASQYFTDAFGDLNHGQYGAFSVEMPANYSEQDAIALYLECDLGTYCLYAGTVGAILQASAG